MEAEGLVGRTLIGRFRIDKILGRGGMATVYAAFDEQRGAPVALKVLKRELTRDAMVLRRFEREAKAASHLRHPNVVEVLDWGVHGEEAFISMELAQGTDLLKALARQRPMKQVRAVLVLSQVCAALSAAHAKGIVHRDLKPENILLIADPSEPGGDRAKVLDFGIAKILDVSKTAASGDDPPSYVTKTALTRVGTIVGTPAYMSPEQCRGGEIDGRSDVYACGVLLYQLVTGELPFTGETPLHTAMRHIHAQPRPPSELRRDLSPALERVIAKALSKWPGERQQSADQLRDELLATLPTLPDRGEVALPETFPRSAPSRAPEPRRPSAVSQTVAAVIPKPPPKVIEPTPNGEDVSNPTRHMAGGPLGATPLIGVRLGRSEAPAVEPGAVSAPAASLAPHTTQPDGRIGPRDFTAFEADEPPTSDAPIDDDNARTFSMDMFGDESSDGGKEEEAVDTAPPAPVAPPPAPRVEVKVKTDPLEQAKARVNAPTLQAAPTPPTPPIPPTPPPPPLAARSKIAKTEPLSQEQLSPALSALRQSAGQGRGPAVAPVNVLGRAPARTDRPVVKAKPTQTGLTPTMPKPPTAGLPPPPPAPRPIDLGETIPSANEEPTVHRHTPSQPPGRASPHPSVAQHAFAQQRPSQPPLAAGDEDEPATYIRDAGPPSKSGKTLVMEESSVAVALSPLRAPHPGGAVTPGPGGMSLSSNYDPQYGSQEGDFRGLKATARIPEEGDRSTNPIYGAAPADNLQGVKATMRMNPQDPIVVPGRNPSAPSGSQPGANRNLDSMQVQTGYRQLQPGSWNEPTVVKRKPQYRATGQKDGLVSLLSGLSGTTGLLIGIGLGLGIAAGLLIAFLLYFG